MPKSVLEAIKMGIWDFEPPEIEYNKFEASDAMPGTREKLIALGRAGRTRAPSVARAAIATTWNRRRRRRHEPAKAAVGRSCLPPSTQ